MTPRHTCLYCEADCAQAGRDERPRDEDCWEGVCDEQPAHISRVYIAHPMSGYPADYLHNCGVMLQHWAALAAAGMHPYCPAADMMLGLMWATIADEPPSVEQYREWSMSWLEVCDVLYVVAAEHRDGETSMGVRAEIERAHMLGIPVVYSIDELLRMRGTEP